MENMTEGMEDSEEIQRYVNYIGMIFMGPWYNSLLECYRMMDLFFNSLIDMPYTHQSNLLYPVFESMCKDEDAETVDVETNEGKEYANELMTGIWYSELYKMFFKNTGAFYHNVVQFALSGCQMILFLAYDNAGAFITSDNPAFEHKSSVVERDNGSGLVFPISPKYLVFVAKGDEGINAVDYRFADAETVKKFNRIINAHKTEIIISLSKSLKDVT